MGAFGLKSGADGNEPVRSTVFPEDDTERAKFPMADGLLDYFPNALAAVAEVSRIGSEKHNKGQPMHWARGKSTDHANKVLRHLADRGAKDASGVRHSAYAAWRILALLQTELEEAGECPPSRASVFPEAAPTHEDMTMPELREKKPFGIRALKNGDGMTEGRIYRFDRVDGIRAYWTDDHGDRDRFTILPGVGYDDREIIYV